MRRPVALPLPCSYDKFATKKMPAPKPVFFDPEGKRWRRLRLVLDTTVIVVTLLVAFLS